MAADESFPEAGPRPSLHSAHQAAAADRDRQTTNAHHHDRLSSRCCHPLTCCCSRGLLCCLGGENFGSTNKILPVTSVPMQFDFIEIRPNRKIRVIHLHGNRRLAVTQRPSNASSADERDAHHQDDSYDDGDEDGYWFENASPKRMQIQQPPPGNAYPANRVFKKFEPQEPPRIAGIKPPRASLLPSRLKNGNGNSHIPGSSSSSSSSTSSPRLQRKKIIPTERLELEVDDDEDCVHSLGDDNEAVHHHHRPPGAAAAAHFHPSVMETNFVASVLSDVSDMVISLTADATDNAKRAVSPLPSSPTSHQSGETSPKPDEKRVATEPDPAAIEKKLSNLGNNESHSTAVVIVEGGHLGGLANLAFEGEDDEEDSPREVTTEAIRFSADSEFARLGDSADAGYHRNRDLSDVVTNAVSEPTQTRHEPSTLPESPPPPPSMHQPPSSSSSLPPPPPPPPLPVLFFLHGVGGSADSWTNQIEFFTAVGYEVVVPDLLGHGFSSVPDKAKSYTFDKLFHDILTIFDHYVGPSRVSAIVGHSYGCAFAAALARTRPANVSMLLLLACGGPSPLAPPRTSKPSQSSYLTARSVLIRCLKPFLMCGYRRQQQFQPKGKTMKYQEAFDVPAYVFQHVMAGQDWPEGDATFHRRISVPTLLVYGLKDPFVSLVEMCEMERTIPRSYLELIPLAGHMLMLDEPKELNAMMKRFVEKYQSSK